MQITLRGLSPELEERIQKLAVEEKISLNKAALKFLAKGAGLMEGKKTVIGKDLDHLFGTWKESDAETFLESIKSCEQIDEDLSRQIEIVYEGGPSILRRQTLELHGDSRHRGHRYDLHPVARPDIPCQHEGGMGFGLRGILA